MAQPTMNGTSRTGYDVPMAFSTACVLLGRHHPLHQRQHDGLLVAQVLVEHLAQAGEPDVEGVAVLLAGVLDEGREAVADRRHQRVDVRVLLAHGVHLDRSCAVPRASTASSSTGQ